MLNRIKAMWAQLWRRRGPRTDEHDFYDQHEASRYRSEAEARGKLESARWRLDVGLGRRAIVWNKIRAALGRLWRPRRRRTAEHDFYDQHEASRYRTLHESRQDGDLPF
jgi:hypothetical protein